MSHRQSSLGSPFHACKWQGNRLLTECQVNSHYSRLSHQWKVGTDMYEFRDRTNYTLTNKFNLSKTSYISSSRVILLFLVISQCKPKTRTRTRTYHINKKLKLKKNTTLDIKKVLDLSSMNLFINI